MNLLVHKLSNLGTLGLLPLLSKKVSNIRKNFDKFMLALTNRKHNLEEWYMCSLQL